MSYKVIINKCESNDKCVLEIDGRYFGYDKVIVDPYPETLYRNIEDAYVFKKPSEALELTSWHPGENFRILPV
ncbi:hypothetical protein ABE073_04715 [Lederbergia citrisecunda]|uniref:hypothetical protein n=1 Tax=Lederbergia citrisecunda TaxID=2833583 RepID=UPI003D2DB8DF